MPTSAALESCASTGSLAAGAAAGDAERDAEHDAAVVLGSDGPVCTSAGDAERNAAAEVVLGSDGPVCTSEGSSLFALGTDTVAYLLGSGALFFFLAIVHCACTASTVACAAAEARRGHSSGQRESKAPRIADSGCTVERAYIVPTGSHGPHCCVGTGVPLHRPASSPGGPRRTSADFSVPRLAGSLLCLFSEMSEFTSRSLPHFGSSERLAV